MRSLRKRRLKYAPLRSTLGQTLLDTPRMTVCSINAPTCILSMRVCVCFSSVNCQRVINKCVNDKLSLDCSVTPHCYVAVFSAYYGHASRQQPANNCTFTLGHCITNASDVWERCDGKRKCEFYVRQSRDVTRSDCSVASEYITVTYSCKCSG